MSQIEVDERTESSEETPRGTPESGRGAGSKVTSTLREGVRSNALPAIVGGTSLVAGLRALLAGKRIRGVAGVVVGATALAVGIGRQRSRTAGRGTDVDESDVAGSGPDVEDIAEETGGTGEADHAGGEAASAVVDTSPDVEAAGSGLESESNTTADTVDQREVADTGTDSEDLAETVESESGASGETTESAEIERLGAAAFDGQSHEVPAPQQAFDRGFLAHSIEAVWGVRDRDGAVLVSRDFDAVEGRDGVQYVASSEIGADARELPIPSAVRTHWDEVQGGGTALSAGEDVLFATTDDLAADHLLRVLPAAWAPEAFDESSE